MRKSKRSFEPDTEDPITYYYRELDESPPRAAIALVSASFERRLVDAILVLLNRRRGSQNPLQLSSKEKKDLMATLPQSLRSKVRLGYEMSIFPRATKTAAEKALKVRNNAVHQTKPLASSEKQEIEKAIQFLH